MEAIMLKVQKYLMISAVNALAVVCMVQVFYSFFTRHHAGNGHKNMHRFNETVKQSTTLLDKAGSFMLWIGELIKNRNRHCCQ